MEQLEVGSCIERYVVERVLGAGGTAMVYLVRHQTLATRHALKVLTITSEGIRNRLITEGRVQGKLKDHPNIVAVYDVLDVQGSPGLVLDYVDGPSLETVLRQYRFGVEDAVLLFEGVLAGVQAAHEAGVAHRDLKPANVLLAETKEGFVPKVTDFGLAKQLVTDQDIRATRQGVAMGTPSYMAPEQIRDAGTVDERADLFSLGCILYELITRRRTFPGNEVLPIYNAVTRGDYMPPRHFVPDLDDAIDVAIRGCLQVNRDQRIPDCATLREVLRGEREWTIYERQRDEEDTEELMVLPPPVLATDAPALTLAPSEVSELLDPAPPLGGPATMPARGARAVSRRSRGWLLWGLGGTGVALAGALVLMWPGSEEPPVFKVDPEVAAPVVEDKGVLADGDEESPELPELALEESVASTPPVEPREAVQPRPSAPVETPAPAAGRSSAPPLEPAPAEVPEVPVVEEVTVRLLSIPPTMAFEVGVEGQPGYHKGRTNTKLQLKPGLHRVVFSGSGVPYPFAIEVVAAGDDEGKNRWCYLVGEGVHKAGSCR